MLPQKLLEELLPGVQRALFKLKSSGKKMPVLKEVSCYELRSQPETRGLAMPVFYVSKKVSR